MPLNVNVFNNTFSKSLFSENGLRQRSNIAKEQRIPLQYMGQILKKLHDKNLISSKRGPSGGLKLSLPLDKITLWEIIIAVEDHIFPVKCLSEKPNCTLISDCMTKDIWSEILDAFSHHLKTKTLFDLAKGKLLKKTLSFIDKNTAG